MKTQQFPKRSSPLDRIFRRKKKASSISFHHYRFCNATRILVVVVMWNLRFRSSSSLNKCFILSYRLHFIWLLVIPWVMHHADTYQVERTADADATNDFFTNATFTTTSLTWLCKIYLAHYDSQKSLFHFLCHFLLSLILGERHFSQAPLN